MILTDDLKSFLDDKYQQYNQRDFIDTDPISIPHQFSKKEDIEIAAFLSATISWGQRPVILKNAARIMQIMEYTPHDFLMNSSGKDLNSIKHFVHRTFNVEDLRFFFLALRNIYKIHNGLEQAFAIKPQQSSQACLHAIMNFRTLFFSLPFPARSAKHISNPLSSSAAKRLCMFLRWMVRKDKNGVDFGLWKVLAPSKLMCPLDIHSGNSARKLNLLFRQQNDWKAVEELTNSLRRLDPEDPVKYDFALFGLGVFEKF